MRALRPSAPELQPWLLLDFGKPNSVGHQTDICLLCVLMFAR